MPLYAALPVCSLPPARALRPVRVPLPASAGCGSWRACASRLRRRRPCSGARWAGVPRAPEALRRRAWAPRARPLRLAHGRHSCWRRGLSRRGRARRDSAPRWSWTGVWTIVQQRGNDRRGAALRHAPARRPARSARPRPSAPPWRRQRPWRRRRGRPRARPWARWPGERRPHQRGRRLARARRRARRAVPGAWSQRAVRAPRSRRRSAAPSTDVARPSGADAST